MHNSNINIIYDNEKEFIFPNYTKIKSIKQFFNRKVSISYKYLIILFNILIISNIIFIYAELSIYKGKFVHNNRLYIYQNKKTNFNYESEMNQPILPENEDESPTKNYSKSFYNNSNIRYHFLENFQNRKKFKINYSYHPYEKIDKSKSYEENADYIYQTTGMLNITKLDYHYFNKNNLNILDFNNIHLSMGHDVKYIPLSLISIASILNTTNNNTYIHFHLVLIGCKFRDMQRIIALKEIYNNVEFIFYNGKQAEYDFSIFGNKEKKGVGDYTRFIIPEIVNNTNRVIILDSADLIAKKDLSEIYFFDLGNNYFGFSLDILAGKFDKFYIFAKNNFYANIGICLVNVRKFRKDNLYMAGYFTRFAYRHLPCPTQEMFFLVSQYKFKFFPLIYNYPQLFNNDLEIKNKIYNNSLIYWYMKEQNNSQYKYTIDEIIDAESNHVINHLFTTKPYWNKANEKNGKIWVNYAKLAKVYDLLKEEYPETFKLYDK